MNLLPPEQVQARLDGGRVDATYDDRYQGLYDARFLDPGDVGQLVQTVTSQPFAPQRLAQVCDRLYSAGFGERLEQIRQRRKEAELLSAVGLAGAEVVSVGVNWAESLVRFLTNPLVAPLADRLS